MNAKQKAVTDNNIIADLAKSNRTGIDILEL